MDADGSHVAQLTFNRGEDITPSWSPDGRMIAFGRVPHKPDRGGNDLDIWTIHADGTGERQLTNTSGADFEPDWSPDGRRIAFASERDHSDIPGGAIEGSFNILTMRSDGSHQMRLSEEERARLKALVEAREWAPAGTTRVEVVSEEATA